MRDSITGRLWDGGVDQLVAAVKGFDTAAVDPDACVASAKRFDRAVFLDSFPREVEAALAEAHHHGSQHKETRRVTRFAWSPVRR